MSTAGHFEPNDAVSLRCHPETPARHVTHVSASVLRGPKQIELTYTVEFNEESLLIPMPSKPYRTDELWRSTCFEAFLSRGGSHYSEFNFSPSTQWAAYQFENYRAGMQTLELDEPPTVHISPEPTFLIVTAILPWTDPGAFFLALSAVIEEKDGTKSYWALKHPPGTPDFHHPDCFALTLAPPERP